MATNENLIPIPGRLHSVATEGHVAGADEIYDDNLGITLDQLSTKHASTGTTGDYPYNGMGRVFLKKNMVNGVNTLTQSMMPTATGGNTVYVIQYDFDCGGYDSEDITIDTSKTKTLDNKTYYYQEIVVPRGKYLILNDNYDYALLNDPSGSSITYNSRTTEYAENSDVTVTFVTQSTGTLTSAYYIGTPIQIPDNSILSFEGGSINNGMLMGNFSIEDCCHTILDSVLFVGNYTKVKVDHLRPEWFGAKGDDTTDDSASISLAIRNANLSGVNKVIFSAVSYYVASSIKITSGNVVLEGNQYKIRNQVYWAENNDIGFEGSTLRADPNISIIKICRNATSSIVIRCLSFTPSGAGSRVGSKAIEYASEWWGPMGRFIVEYCRFVGFDKAIYFGNQEREYFAYDVVIRYCYFLLDGYCIYEKEGNQINGIQIYRCEMNSCVRFIKLKCIITNFDIVNCNLEGELKSSNPWYSRFSAPESDYMFELTIAAQCALTFRGNYWENNLQQPLMHIAAITGGGWSHLPYNEMCKLSVFENCYIGSQPNYHKIVVDGDILLDKTDINLVVNSGILCTDCLTSNIFIKDSANCAVAFNQKDRTHKNTPISSSFNSYVNATQVEGFFKENKLYVKANTNNNAFMVTSIGSGESGSKRIISAVFMQDPANIEQSNNSFFISDNIAYGSVCKTKTGYKYIALFTTVPSDLSNRNFSIGAYKGVSVHIGKASLFSVTDNSENIATDLAVLPNGINYGLTSIGTSGKEIGDKMFFTNKGREAIWDGSYWIYGDGTHDF